MLYNLFSTQTVVYVLFKSRQLYSILRKPTFQNSISLLYRGQEIDLVKPLSLSISSASKYSYSSLRYTPLYITVVHSFTQYNSSAFMLLLVYKEHSRIVLQSTKEKLTSYYRFAAWRRKGAWLKKTRHRGPSEPPKAHSAGEFVIKLWQYKSLFDL